MAISAWYEHVPFAFWLISAARPRSLVELGTHAGTSYCAFCQAIDRLAVDCRAFAIDTWHGDHQSGLYGDEVFNKLRDYHDQRYGHFSSLVRSTFDEALSHFDDRSIDLLHIDGLHTYDAVRRDFESWLPKLSSRAVVLFHDVNVREGDFGVARLWDEVSGAHPHFTFDHGHGLGVLAVGPDAPPALRPLFMHGADTVEGRTLRIAYARLGRAISDSFQAAHAAAEVGARIVGCRASARTRKGGARTPRREKPRSSIVLSGVSCRSGGGAAEPLRHRMRS